MRQQERRRHCVCNHQLQPKLTRHSTTTTTNYNLLISPLSRVLCSLLPLDWLVADPLYYSLGCTELFMQRQCDFALTRYHESWPGGESRRRDCLRRVTYPLEGRSSTHPLTAHNSPTCPPGLRGMCRAAASPTGFRRPPRQMRPSPLTNTPASQSTRIAARCFASNSGIPLLP